MNPYTKSLLDELNEPKTRVWTKKWDIFESLVIEIHRKDEVRAEQQEEFNMLIKWLRKHYPAWQAEFEPHWQGLSAGGRKLATDPFKELMAVPEAGAFVGNWRAMQLLPAAREALNLYLVERIQRQDPGKS